MSNSAPLAPTKEPQVNRRGFLRATGKAMTALVASNCMVPVAARSPGELSAPSLVPDPAGVIDLRPGFSYRVLSRLGDAMDDGLTVPDRADGMGCFDLGDGRLALVRNHELSPGHDTGGALPSGYRRDDDGTVFPGGTTTQVIDAASMKTLAQYRSLAGTIRNCAGGITPWGSWLTCEEPGWRDMQRPDHGFVFEVPARATGLVDPVPLKAMGRFNHEAACVDPVTGIVYMTEDTGDSLLYRFLPNVPGELARGGRLQAMVLGGLSDTRKWNGPDMAVGRPLPARWIDLKNVEAPDNDLRLRGAAQGAAVIARGEGIHLGLDSAGRTEMYICATSGGTIRHGQVFRLVPGVGGQADSFELFFESTDPAQFSYGDNLTVAPNGHLVVCEDRSGDTTDNHLRGITPEGVVYPIGHLRMQTELAGACFAPDGKTMFVNAYSPTMTLAISGPWAA